MSSAAHDALSAAGASRIEQSVADYSTLTKPEVNLVIAVATLTGLYMGGPTQSHEFPFVLLVPTLFGTLLVAGGAGALTQMRRTARRPLPAGRIEPWAALGYGVFLSFAGCAYLALAANALTSFLAVLTLLTHLFAYIPLKRETPLCMVVGAFPGAMPPLIGWAASSSRVPSSALMALGVVPVLLGRAAAVSKR
jgi:protoheme IX farnesyltransferase